MVPCPLVRSQKYAFRPAWREGTGRTGVHVASLKNKRARKKAKGERALVVAAKQAERRRKVVCNIRPMPGMRFLLQRRVRGDRRPSACATHANAVCSGCGRVEVRTPWRGEPAQCKEVGVW